MTAEPVVPGGDRQCQLSRVFASLISTYRRHARVKVIDARLDAVALAERRTIPVPYGHHVYVVSDLSLSPSTNVHSRPLREFLNLLGDIDDAAIVVVAGNLFHPGPTSDLAKFIDATMEALPTVA